MAEAVLFLFALTTVGVFDPQLNVVNFDKLTVRGAVAEFTNSNLYNQMRWLALSALAGLLVLRNPMPFVRSLPSMWPLGLLFSLCLASTIWSPFPDVTIRRALGLMLPAFCLLAAIVHLERRRAPFILYLAFWCALILNLAVAPFPVAFDEFGFFRGAFGNKNSLGALAALALIFGFIVGAGFSGVGRSIINLLYLAAWAGTLVMTVSKTAIGLVFVVPALFILLDTAARLSRLGVGWVLFGFGLLAVTALGTVIGLTGAAPAEILSAVFPDPTFTGRTQIWEFMISQIGSNWLLGNGFGSLWGVGFAAPNLSSIYDYVRLINQAHNGYLDVIAGVGLAGLAIIVLAIWSSLQGAERLRSTDPALFRLVCLLILFSLLHNSMESSLLVPFSCVWHTTLFAMYLAMLPPARDGIP